VDRTYIARLERKIENMWQKLGARKPTDPEVKLKFVVNLGGELENLRLEPSSGKADIDQNALKSVKRSAPFEKLLHIEDLKTIPTRAWFQATF
jgi:TonB family protein